MNESFCVLIGTGLLGIAAPILVNYLSEKGKNQATKEDIKEITKLVEQVKSEHSEKLEKLKGDLSHEINRSKFRYEKEYVLLAELLDLIYPLRDSAFSIPLSAMLPEQLRNETAEQFRKDRQAVRSFLERKRAFFPKNIYEEIIKLFGLATMHQTRIERLANNNSSPGEETWKQLNESSEKIIQSHDQVIEIIRERVREWKD